MLFTTPRGYAPSHREGRVGRSVSSDEDEELGDG
jgi:hypothetical protein